jgi:hypothetical protein
LDRIKFRIPPNPTLVRFVHGALTFVLKIVEFLYATPSVQLS